MFKSLKEKVLTSDSKNDSGEQNLSRFSSINSLVSDVGSVFSKVITIPQHVQPSNKNSKHFQDNESVSEYDDSLIQGDVINKEELFQRYQRAQILAKRYKTRSLEVIEAYKKLEIENMKLTQTLTESQDYNIKRVAELREQMVLDKKSKVDVDENYRLMIDEYSELINVLRLQISLLKEGKDLPSELESQIKEKHDLEIQKQKRKDDELNDLRSSMAQKDNLLQRCKEKITSLNSQLMELKSKYNNIENTSLSGDSLNSQFSSDLTKQRFQHVTALENVQKEHSERIKIMLCDFEEKKTILEAEIQENFEEKYSKLKQDLNESKEQMNRIFQDNERLQEQVNIKTKIIEELMNSQDKMMMQSSEKSHITEDKSDCYDETNSFFSQDTADSVNNSQVNDLIDENKFLHGRIDQMEALKLQTEEEISKIEEELKNVELKLKKEKEDCEVKCNSYEVKLEQMKVECSGNVTRIEQLSVEVLHLNTVLLKKKEESDIVAEDYKESTFICQSLETQLKKSKDEIVEILLKLETTRKSKEELELQLQSVYKEYESDKYKFLECQSKCKELQDSFDELSVSLENEMHEKKKLLTLLNVNGKEIQNQMANEDVLGLKIVEMRQRYDQEIEDGQNLLSEKLCDIRELNITITTLKKENEEIKQELNEVKSMGEELVQENKRINEENKGFRNEIEEIVNLNKSLLKNKEECEELSKSIKIENDHLKSKEKQLTFDLDHLMKEKADVVVEVELLRMKCKETETKVLDYVTESEHLRSQLSSKEEALQLLSEEKKIIQDTLLSTQNESGEINEENLAIKAKQESLINEIVKINDRIVMLEEYEVKYNSLKEENEIKVSEIDKLQSCLENEKELLKSKENCILPLQQSLEDNEKEIIKLTQEKNILDEKVHIIEKYLKIFQQWNDDIVLVSAKCGEECNIKGLDHKDHVVHKNLEDHVDHVDQADSKNHMDYWNNDLREGCLGIDELLSFGSNLQRVLSSWSFIHDQLHLFKDEISNWKHDEKHDNNTFMKAVKEFCIGIEDEDDDNDLTEDGIIRRLSQIRCEKTLIENNYKKIEEILANDVLYDATCDESSVLNKLILERVTYFKTKQRENEDEINKLRNEREVIGKKYDKMLNDKMQHFKLIANLFELTSIDFEHKSFSKMVIKGLKEYVLKHATLSKEFNETLLKMEQVEQELILSREECTSKQSELTELTASIEEDRLKLLTMRLELDRSLEKLNEFSDEKGRIDEEKQSMKKELNELNAKIQQLKCDFEKQMNEKQKLEKQFDESLDKVKANHLALEETYKKEIEKQHGYQHYLEEQITVNMEETSRKLTEKEHVSNIKLEGVLQQSEQLLVLNNQYKDLLDKAGMDTNAISENFKQLSLKYESLEQDVKRYKSENELLTNKIKELTEINEVTKLERSGFKMDLDNLISDKKKTSELLNKSHEDEKFVFRDQVKDLEDKISAYERDLQIIKESYKLVENECNGLKSEKTRLLDQLNDCDKKNNLLKSDISEKTKTIKDYITEIDMMQTKINDITNNHEKEIFELKQQFDEDKSNIDDDHNHRVKKLAKDFNEKILEKEHEFQKTFQEVLENIRKDEARQKSDMKSEIDQLNHIMIELEIEKNSLMNTITDLEDDVKKIGSQVQMKDFEMQSLKDKILGYTSEISELELKHSKMKSLVDDVEQRSKINQTVDTHSYFEESTVDTVNANDHDVLQMHCSDVEEQVRQLHLENIRLKESIIEHQTLSSISPSREQLISATKSHVFASQPSFDNVSLKSSNIINTSYLRSPNTSCSEYQFCPYPITEATEYEYLHDILVKYMTGLETNTLARVLCTVMKFNNDETNRILRFEQDKKKVLQIFPR